MPFFCFSLNSYLDLFVSAVNCGQDKEGRYEVNVEKDLVELTVQSVSKNTKEKLHSFLQFFICIGSELWTGQRGSI